MQLKDFMQENYPNLELKPPLFYCWDIAIRFELGIEREMHYDCLKNSYILRCYKRAITLFESLHSPTEDIFVVMDINDLDKGKSLKRQLKNFSPYVEKSLLFRLNYQEMPYIFPEDDEDGIRNTTRFILKCKTSDVKYIPMIRAICNQDLGLRPHISHSVYFININRKTIFHIYDDRGCDLLATSNAALRDIYHKHNDWILNYDRAEIEKIFK